MKQTKSQVNQMVATPVEFELKNIVEQIKVTNTFLKEIEASSQSQINKAKSAANNLVKQEQSIENSLSELTRRREGILDTVKKHCHYLEDALTHYKTMHELIIQINIKVDNMEGNAKLMVRTPSLVPTNLNKQLHQLTIQRKDIESIEQQISYLSNFTETFIKKSKCLVKKSTNIHARDRLKKLQAECDQNISFFEKMSIDLHGFVNVEQNLNRICSEAMESLATKGFIVLNPDAPTHIEELFIMVRSKKSQFEAVVALGTSLVDRTDVMDKDHIATKLNELEMRWQTLNEALTDCQKAMAKKRIPSQTSMNVSGKVITT